MWWRVDQHRRGALSEGNNGESLVGEEGDVGGPSRECCFASGDGRRFGKGKESSTGKRNRLLFCHHDTFAEYLHLLGLQQSKLTSNCVGQLQGCVECQMLDVGGGFWVLCCWCLVLVFLVFGAHLLPCSPAVVLPAGTELTGLKSVEDLLQLLFQKKLLFHCVLSFQRGM